MELECVESLGPDTLPPPPPTHHDPLLTKAAAPAYYHYPPAALPRATSPLTRSPSPSPKRRRITYPSPPSRPRRFVHPLATLTSRDPRHAVAHPDHLAATPVTPAMREEVVAWCADMVADLHLPEAIVAAAVNLFDRFVLLQPVCKTVLYALTASSLLLACKLVLDDGVPHDEISSRARVPLEDIHVMEAVILNVLEWCVNVVTPHEVVHELAMHAPDTEAAERLRALQDSLMLNVLLDYRLASLRATSVGVACYILSANVAAGQAYADHTTHSVYSLASRCGVSLPEVDLCVARLREGITTLFEDIESVNSDDDDESDKDDPGDS